MWTYFDVYKYGTLSKNACFLHIYEITGWVHPVLLTQSINCITNISLMTLFLLEKHIFACFLKRIYCFLFQGNIHHSCPKRQRWRGDHVGSKNVYSFECSGKVGNNIFYCLGIFVFDQRNQISTNRFISELNCCYINPKTTNINPHETFWIRKPWNIIH